MKAVLISIHPKWVNKIASREKTIEIRKTKPNLQTPFKCYIYETQAREKIRLFGLNCISQGRGKVVGEFVCDDIDTVQVFNDILYCVNNSQANKLGQMCLTIKEIKAYLRGRKGYNLHITALKIYDKPKELSEFRKAGYLTEEDWLAYLYPNTHCHYEAWAKKFIIEKPPQSWYYVEELK